MEKEYKLIRSNRKTVSVEITKSLEIVVRAPKRMALRDVSQFVQRHSEWIAVHLEKQKQRMESNPPPTPQEMEALKAKAKAYLPGRVAHYAALMGCEPTAVKITSAKTRFGSCSGKNSICFSCLLMRYPAEAIDYVVVHELAHIVHKNHSRAFYALIAQYMPDYQRRRGMLKA